LDQLNASATAELISVNGLGTAYHVLPVSRHINAKRRTGKVDLTDQFDAAIKNHYLRPVMEFGSPRSESHHSAVVVRFRADGRTLKRAGARHRVGTDHLRTGDIEQEHLAREPVVREIPGKRTYGRAVSRDYGRPAEPIIGLTEANDSLISATVKLVESRAKPAVTNTFPSPEIR
jgi:hypothetical protein